MLYENSLPIIYTNYQVILCVHRVICKIEEESGMSHSAPLPFSPLPPTTITHIPCALLMSGSLNGGGALTERCQWDLRINIIDESDPYVEHLSL